MKTVVEWLQEKVSVGLTYEQEVLFEAIFEQAKEMEKDNIEDAFFHGVELFKIRFESLVDEPNFEDYYNEKYN